MQIDVREAARLFAVSEKTIYRWLKAGNLPGYRVQGQYRFNRAELLEWATSRRLSVNPDLFPKEAKSDAPPPSLEAALRAGGIHSGVDCSNKTDAFTAIVGLIPLPGGIDRGFLLQVLLSRESIGSTGIGDGIALPHVRNPIVLHATTPTITLCFLANPIPFDAIDGKPVHTLFTLITPSVQAHLQLLSRLTFALRTQRFRSAIESRATREEIFEAAAAVDEDLAAASAEHPR